MNGIGEETNCGESIAGSSRDQPLTGSREAPERIKNYRRSVEVNRLVGVEENSVSVRQITRDVLRVCVS
jgi:hypothetical protein